MRCVIYLRVSTREQAEKGEEEEEEGFSIPAQREPCTRHVRDAGWLFADENVDRGESDRSADRPALKAMLTRIAEDRDVDAVVVHKIDRLARNMEDHVAIRALFRRRGAALVSVTENVEETASGRLVKGIHALMAEFYSANLANKIKKGLNQKVKLGGFPHGAPSATSTCANSSAAARSPASCPTLSVRRSSPARSSVMSPGNGPCNVWRGNWPTRASPTRACGASPPYLSPGRAWPRSSPTRSTSASWSGTASSTPAPTSR